MAVTPEPAIDCGPACEPAKPERLIVGVTPSVTHIEPLTKQVALCTPCGKRHCGCDPCKHDGPRCRSGKCGTSRPVNCEPFDLVYCLSQCPGEFTTAEFLVLKQGCSDVLVTVPAVRDRQGCLRANVPTGALAPGWYRVMAKIVTDGTPFYGAEKTFRVDEGIDCVPHGGPYCEES